MVDGFGRSHQGARTSEIGSVFWHTSGVRHLIAKFALGVASLNPRLQAVAPPGDLCGPPCSLRLPVRLTVSWDQFSKGKEGGSDKTGTVLLPSPREPHHLASRRGTGRFQLTQARRSRSGESCPLSSCQKWPSSRARIQALSPFWERTRPRPPPQSIPEGCQPVADGEGSDTTGTKHPIHPPTPDGVAASRQSLCALCVLCGQSTPIELPIPGIQPQSTQRTQNPHRPETRHPQPRHRDAPGHATR